VVSIRKQTAPNIKGYQPPSLTLIRLAVQNEKSIAKNITINSATSAAIVATVTVTCDGTKVNGLVKADFKLLNGAGAAQAIDTVTEVDGV
jgi:hypothetical protein